MKFPTLLQSLVQIEFYYLHLKNYYLHKLLLMPLLHIQISVHFNIKTYWNKRKKEKKRRKKWKKKMKKKGTSLKKRSKMAPL